MKGLSNRLLVRRALLLALLLIVLQVAWIFLGGLVIWTELATRLATEVALARAALTTMPPQDLHRFTEQVSRQLGIELKPDDAAMRVETGGMPRPEMILPPIVTRLRDIAGADVDVRGDPLTSRIWIRFTADNRPYWLAVPLGHAPVLMPASMITWVSVALLVSLTGGYLWMRQLNRTLSAVLEASRTIARGQIPRKLDVQGPEEIRELSRGFNQMSEALQALETERRLMLAGISHDLRTPLTRLRLAVELIDAEVLPARARTMTQDICEIDSILAQFLEFARTESDEAPHPCNLSALVADICSHYRQGGHEIRTDLGRVGTARLRKVAIRRLITNLVDNALRYGEKDVRIATRRNAGQLILEVTDRGPGVHTCAPDDLIKPFAREDSSRRKPGTGLGLTVVDRIARAHGGSLRLSNRPDGGFLAVVTLCAEL